MIAVNHNSINWVLTRSLEVSGDSHVEILLQHSICPVLFHLGGVKFVFFLVDEAQMSGQTSFVVLNADNISTGPVIQKCSLTSSNYYSLTSPAGSLFISLLEELPDRLSGFLLLTAARALSSHLASLTVITSYLIVHMSWLIIDRSWLTVDRSWLVTDQLWLVIDRSWLNIDWSWLIVESGSLCEVSAGRRPQDCLSKDWEIFSVQCHQTNLSLALIAARLASLSSSVAVSAGSLKSVRSVVSGETELTLPPLTTIIFYSQPLALRIRFMFVFFDWNVIAGNVF